MSGAQDCILKIGIPNRELTSEIECLRLWSNLQIVPTVRLLESDPENGLLLLERLRPGETLATLTDDDRATEIAADVMSRLWISAPERHNFISLKNWFDELKNLRPRFGGGRVHSLLNWLKQLKDFSPICLPKKRPGSSTVTATITTFSRTATSGA